MLRMWFGSYRDSRLRRNLVRSTRASVVAFLAPLVATPILTRLYSPEDFAAAAVFQGVLVMLAGLGCWRMDWMLPNAADQDEAVALSAAGALVGVTVSLLIAALLWSMRARFERWHGAAVLGPLLFVLPVGVFALTIRDLLNAWFLREADLKVPSTARISHALSRTAVSVGAGGADLGPSGLIAGQIAGAVASVGVLSLALRQQFKTVRGLTRERMMGVRRHASQASLSVAVTLVRNSTQMIVPILLIQYFSDAEAGWYSLMHRVAVGPLNVFTTALGQSFWAEAAKLAREDPVRLRNLHYRTTKRLLLISIPIVLLCIAGPVYIGPIFGRDEWTDAGYVFQRMAPMIVGALVVAPLNHLVVHRRQAWQLLADGCRLVLMVGIIAIGASVLSMGFHLIVFLTSMAHLISYLILFLLNRKSLRTDHREDSANAGVVDVAE